MRKQCRPFLRTRFLSNSREMHSAANAIPGVLSHYARDQDTRLLMFESGDLSFGNTVIFIGLYYRDEYTSQIMFIRYVCCFGHDIGGLTDTMLSVPYLPQLSTYLHSIGWNLAQITLSSSCFQYGLSSLARDVEEISLAVEYRKLYFWAILLGLSS
jgi:hypothetical protein